MFLREQDTSLWVERREYPRFLFNNMFLQPPGRQMVEQDATRAGNFQCAFKHPTGDTRWDIVMSLDRVFV